MNLSQNLPQASFWVLWPFHTDSRAQAGKCVGCDRTATKARGLVACSENKKVRKNMDLIAEYGGTGALEKHP